LAISGAILLGLDDVLSEEMVKHHGGVHEVLFCKWIWGVGIAVAQLLIFERESFMSLFHDDGTCGLSTQFVLLGLFTTFQVLDMAGEVNFLSISEACLLNLSLLSTNLYAAIFTAVRDRAFPAMSYLVALALVLLGIVLYEAGPSPVGHDTPSNINIKIRTKHQIDKEATQHITNVARHDIEMT